ncbi:MAG TPA: hypothetical protein PKV35_06540 [bacterium]|nr:hypothetical protein [bacterium]
MKKLSEIALLADLTISAWSGSIADKKTTDEILDKKNARRDRGRFVKNLLMDTKSLKTITNKMYHEYKMKSTAWEDGRRLLPVEFFDSITKLHRDCSDELEKALDEFGKSYPEYKEKAKEELGDLYDETEFPSFDEFKRKWKIRLDFFPIPESKHFVVKAEKNLINEMKKSFDEAINSKQTIAIGEVKERVFETVNKIVERISDKHMKFSRQGKEVMDSVRELVDLLPSLNLFDDPNINKMIDELKTNLYEVNDEDLKKKDKRKKILDKTKAMLDKMSDYA